MKLTYKYSTRAAWTKPLADIPLNPGWLIGILDPYNGLWTGYNNQPGFWTLLTSYHFGYVKVAPFLLAIWLRPLPAANKYYWKFPSKQSNYPFSHNIIFRHFSWQRTWRFLVSLQKNGSLLLIGDSHPPKKISQISSTIPTSHRL